MEEYQDKLKILPSRLNTFSMKVHVREEKTKYMILRVQNFDTDKAICGDAISRFSLVEWRCGDTYT